MFATEIARTVLLYGALDGSDHPFDVGLARVHNDGFYSRYLLARERMFDRKPALRTMQLCVRLVTIVLAADASSNLESPELRDGANDLLTELRTLTGSARYLAAGVHLRVQSARMSRYERYLIDVVAQSCQGITKRVELDAIVEYINRTIQQEEAAFRGHYFLGIMRFSLNYTKPVCCPAGVFVSLANCCVHCPCCFITGSKRSSRRCATRRGRTRGSTTMASATPTTSSAWPARCAWPSSRPASGKCASCAAPTS